MPGSIIIDIEEVSISFIILEFEYSIKEWNKMLGIKYWNNNISDYIKQLEDISLTAWEITSAIGFYGFVIAKRVESY